MNTVEHAVLVEAPKADRPFDIVMGIWARWMRLRDHQHSLSDGNPQDTKEFMALGEAVDVMVDGLPRVQWWAVHRSKGICTVWRFPEVSLMDALADAETTLTPKLMKHVATKRYFA
jgi:hypothetical protein